MLEFKEITSKDNHKIKLIRSLQKSAKERKEKGLFVIEGIRICKDAVSNGITVELLVLSKSLYEKSSDDIIYLANHTRNGIIVSDSLFKTISDTVSPQGVIALAVIPVVSKCIDSSGRYIALENLSDPSNIGAVARTAEALGIDGIIVSGDSCDIYSPKSLRASMGTLLRIPLYFCKDIIPFLAQNNLKGYACIPRNNADVKIGEYKFGGGDVLIIGNEANGLCENTIKNAYKTATISMSGKAESLNAAVAASISMWELLK